MNIGMILISNKSNVNLKFNKDKHTEVIKSCKWTFD